MRGSWVVVAAFVAASWCASASAKNLTGRFGVGYENTLALSADGAGDDSSIAFRFWAAPKMFIGGQLGFQQFDPDADGADSESAFGVGVSAGYAVQQEENMNLFVGGGLQFGSVPVGGGGGPAGDTDTETMTAINLGLGAEFFLQGLPNLGFTTSFGLRYANVSEIGTSIAIGGDEFAVFGIRYYFGK